MPVLVIAKSMRKDSVRRCYSSIIIFFMLSSYSLHKISSDMSCSFSGCATPCEHIIDNQVANRIRDENRTQRHSKQRIFANPVVYTPRYSDKPRTLNINISLDNIPHRYSLITFLFQGIGLIILEPGFLGFW